MSCATGGPRIAITIVFHQEPFRAGEESLPLTARFGADARGGVVAEIVEVDLALQQPLPSAVDGVAKDGLDELGGILGENLEMLWGAGLGDERAPPESNEITLDHLGNPARDQLLEENAWREVTRDLPR